MVSSRTIDFLKDIAAKNNGLCLSKEYINIGTKYEWECSKRHRWLAIGNNVRQGSWCLICSRKSNSIDKIQQVAVSKGGKFLSSEYRNNREKYEWECSKGHRWFSCYGAISQGSWCPHCAGRQKHNIDWLHELAQKQNGYCNADTYINGDTKYEWVCQLGHYWQAQAFEIKRGSWCPRCVSNKKKLSLTYMKDWAKNKNGECLSDFYANTQTDIKWKCHSGHTWLAKPSDVLYQDTWCPHCVNHVSKAEGEIIDFIKSAAPDIEIISSDRTVLSPKELDIYIPSKGIAIEYTGLMYHGERIKKKIARTYHYNKWYDCKNKSIQLITIFENEWISKKTIVKGILLNKLGLATSVKVNARECDIRDVKRDAAKVFLDTNHIQGGVQGSYTGLFYKDKLVALLAYNTKKDNKTEILRYATDFGCSVRGGFSKLLKTLSGEVYTFSDNRYSTGALYDQTGFVSEKSVAPSYWYFKNRTTVYHKSLFRKDKIADKLGALLSKETEWEAMLRFGFDRIWDCGKIKWHLTLP